jgi:DNA-binding GntR family transcriptional regulator
VRTEQNTAFEPTALRAYRALEQMIVTLELAPGSVTTEGALIERLGLGRTPVREAVQRLAWEGLLEIRPRAGLAVAALHAGDWLKVLDAMRGVEAVLARSAARFVSRETAARFQAAALAMQAAVEKDDVIAYLEADKARDEGMAAAGDSI